MDAGPPETDTHDRAHAHDSHHNRASAISPVSSIQSSHPPPSRYPHETTQSPPSSSRPATAATVQTCAAMSKEKAEEERGNTIEDSSVNGGTDMRSTAKEPVVDTRQLVEHSGAEGGHGEGAPMPTETVPQSPQTTLTFLLVNGRRKTMGFEPDMAVGRVKDLVWNAWPSGEFYPNALLDFLRAFASTFD